MSESENEKSLEARFNRELMLHLEKQEAIRENNRIWGRVVSVLIVIIVLLLIFW